jgi:hypothetical protein
MSASLHVPLVLRVKNAEDVSVALLKIQTQEYGRVKIVSIEYDPSQKNWVVFYYPIRSVDGGSI